VLHLFHVSNFGQQRPAAVDACALIALAACRSALTTENPPSDLCPFISMWHWRSEQRAREVLLCVCGLDPGRLELNSLLFRSRGGSSDVLLVVCRLHLLCASWIYRSTAERIAGLPAKTQRIVFYPAPSTAG
jgi:hypothetical protein